jgi:hypothetical protein
MPDTVNPLEYRAELCKRILDVAARGQSCSVIGVSSSGKGNIARQLARADVRAYCLGAEANGLWGVLVDFLHYAEPEPASFYRMFLEGLKKAAEQTDAPAGVSAAKAEFKKLWEDATETQSKDRVRGYLQDALALAFARGVTRLFFLLDDFDKVLLMDTPPSAFNSLRGIRDNHKHALAYVPMLRREIGFLLKGAGKSVKDYEDFYELVYKPVIPVGACNWADCNRAIDRLARNSKYTPTQLERDKLVEFSGGHVGLIRTMFLAAAQGTLNLGAPSALAVLQKRADVAADCSKIWDSLEKDEHAALQALAQGQPIKDDLAFRLGAKDIITSGAGGANGAGGAARRMLIPLFESWVVQRLAKSQPVAPASASASSQAQLAQIFLDPTSKNILIDGRLIHDLDEVTFELFKVLFVKRNHPVLPPELFEVMRQYPAHGTPGGPPDQRLERLMTELLDRVNIPSRQYIVSEPDGSYKLVA